MNECPLMKQNNCNSHRIIYAVSPFSYDILQCPVCFVESGEQKSQKVNLWLWEITVQQIHAGPGVQKVLSKPCMDSSAFAFNAVSYECLNPGEPT